MVVPAGSDPAEAREKRTAWTAWPVSGSTSRPRCRLQRRSWPGMVMERISITGPDLEGEIGANAEQHAREMTVPGYAMALRELAQPWTRKPGKPAPDDIVVLRKLWKSSMGVSCGAANIAGRRLDEYQIHTRPGKKIFVNDAGVSVKTIPGDCLWHEAGLGNGSSLICRGSHGISARSYPGKRHRYGSPACDGTDVPVR